MLRTIQKERVRSGHKKFLIFFEFRNNIIYFVLQIKIEKNSYMKVVWVKKSHIVREVI